LISGPAHGSIFPSIPRLPIAPRSGKFSGTLHLRAPRTNLNQDLAVIAPGGEVIGASAITLEGVGIYQLSDRGNLTPVLRNTIVGEAVSFLGDAGETTTGYQAMMNRLSSRGFGQQMILMPGVELFNPAGDITLGSATGFVTDWICQRRDSVRIPHPEC
jgi:filamentous hemagglutinin